MSQIRNGIKTSYHRTAHLGQKARILKVSLKAAGLSALTGLRSGPCDGMETLGSLTDIAAVTHKLNGRTLYAECLFEYETEPKFLSKVGF